MTVLVTGYSQNISELTCLLWLIRMYSNQHFQEQKCEADNTLQWKETYVIIHKLSCTNHNDQYTSQRDRSFDSDFCVTIAYSLTGAYQ